MLPAGPALHNGPVPKDRRSTAGSPAPATTRGARLAPLLAVALVPGLAGCLFQRAQPGVVIASTPPGATIFVDGQDTGFSTPAALSLTRSDWHRVDLQLRGYHPAARLFSPSQRAMFVPWTDGYIGPSTWYFPIFMEFQWFAFPLRVDDNLTPTRVHVNLVNVAEDP